jgi:hypothetical protein
MANPVSPLWAVGAAFGRPTQTGSFSESLGFGMGAMDQGLRFAIREGGRTVGAGVVAEIKADAPVAGKK